MYGSVWVLSSQFLVSLKCVILIEVCANCRFTQMNNKLFVYVCDFYMFAYCLSGKCALDVMVTALEVVATLTDLD